jgi:hypothetical protein
MPSGNLIVVVDHEIDALDRFLARLPSDYQTISIGRELSAYLAEPNEIDRSQLASQWTLDRLKEMAPGPIICRDIDLLFHRSFKIDPLALLRRASQFTQLIVLWPGTYADGVLSYARPEHKHYRYWRNLEGIKITGVYDDALS